MKFGPLFELHCPKSLDSGQWYPGDGQNVIMEAMEQIEFADNLGFDYVFEVEYDFLDEYAHSSAPEIVLAAAGQRNYGHDYCHREFKALSAENRQTVYARRFHGLTGVHPQQPARVQGRPHRHGGIYRPERRPAPRGHHGFDGALC